MRYLLLLRGVNVGGRNKVDMPELKRHLESVGFPEAETYLNSGNILMNADCPREEAALRVRGLLKTNYAFDIPFALLTAETLKADLQSLPRWWSAPIPPRRWCPGSRRFPPASRVC